VVFDPDGINGNECSLAGDQSEFLCANTESSRGPWYISGPKICWAGSSQSCPFTGGESEISAPKSEPFFRTNQNDTGLDTKHRQSQSSAAAKMHADATASCLKRIA
jgi:hypothetical protein